MKKATRIDDQLRQFIVYVDALAERLKPVRRPQDRNQPECSQQELRALAALGQRDTLTMSELAEMLNVPVSTATHTIDRLFAKGLVERKGVPRDRRIVQITFSRKGKRINQFVLESRLAIGRALLEALSSRGRDRFLRQLAAITGAAASKKGDRVTQRHIIKGTQGATQRKLEASSMLP